MKINKNELHNGLWCEDQDGNYIPYDGDIPDNAYTYHKCFPLEVREEVYVIGDRDGNPIQKGKPSFVSSCFIGGGNQDAIIGMATSGDYTLAEALALWADCCERCINVLAWKYTNGKDGYKEYSEEWKRCNTVCKHCKEDSCDDKT